MSASTDPINVAQAEAGASPPPPPPHDFWREVLVHAIALLIAHLAHHWCQHTGWDLAKKAGSMLLNMAGL